MLFNSSLPTNATISSTFSLEDVVGFSVALVINVLVALFAILIFLINKGFVLPILCCQSIGFQLKKLIQKDPSLENTFELFHVRSGMIPKLIVITLVVGFIILRVIMICFRIVQYSLYGGNEWSVMGAIGSCLLILGAGCNVTLFSTFLLLWIQFIHSINTSQKLIHPVGFVLFFLMITLANLLVWLACIAVAITFAIPKSINNDSTVLLISALVPGSAFVLGIFLLDVVMIIAGITIIATLFKSYWLQKRMLAMQNQSATALNQKTKNLVILAVRFAIVIISFLFAINIIILGLIVIAVGGHAWIITIFMQTIPECLAVVAMCIFFLPLYNRKTTNDSKTAANETLKDKKELELCKPVQPSFVLITEQVDTVISEAHEETITAEGQEYTPQA